MTTSGYVATRDALHSLIETGLTSYLTATNVTNDDYRVLDKGVKYAAVLVRGTSEIQPAPPNISDWVFEILIEMFVRYENEATTYANMRNFQDALRDRIEQNPGLLRAKWIIQTGTNVTALDEPQPVFMRGIVQEASIPVFIVSVMHVKIERRERITRGEFRS